jgi:hypothetical protein
VTGRLRDSHISRRQLVFPSAGTPARTCVLATRSPPLTAGRFIPGYSILFSKMSDRAQAELPNISIALQVERLDPTLFRSTTLHRPWRARGVFGGHVISQALVSATRSVDSDFGLHVR